MRKGLWVVVASILLLTTAAARSQTSPTVIRVGTESDDGATPLLWARSAGLFAKAGLSVSIERVTNSAAATTAVFGGDLEIARANALALVVAQDRSQGFSIVAPAASYRSEQPDAALVVLTGSTRSRARDFTDQTIGVPAIGDMNSLAARAWLDKNGSGQAVRLVEVGATPLAALDAGRVAGVTLNEPALSAAVASRKVRVVTHVFDAIAPRYVESAYFARTSWILANRDAADRFLAVMREANAYVAAHESETIALIAPFLSRDPATLAQMARPERPVDVDPAELQPIIALLVRDGLIARTFPAQQIVYPNALAPARAPQRR
jgi:ABC-type nitrate/sulfonate/bicarbonate transport system substrate-binding protein